MRLPTVGLRILKLAIFLSIVVTGQAYADPIRVITVEALEPAGNGQITSIDLATNSGVILRGSQVSFGSELRSVVTFAAVLAGRQSGVLSETFDIPDDWARPFSNLTQTGSITGADVIVFGLDFPLLYHPVPVGLTLSVPGVPGGGVEGPHQFTFSVVQPTPEPATLVLLGTGTAAVLLRRRRGKRFDPTASDRWQP